MDVLDCLIVGGGPAGLTAGIYACRANMKVLLLESMFPGGQIITTHLLENFPGFPNGINGAEFGMLIQEHAENMGLTIEYDEAAEFELSGGVKHVRTAGGKDYYARTIILAMGAYPARLGIPKEAEWTGNGLSYCATCDGSLYRGKSVALVGGGDTALVDALYLANVVEKVYLIHRRDTFRGAASLAQKAAAHPNIELVMDAVAVELEGDAAIQGLKVQNVKTQEIRDLQINALFVAVGVIPRTDLIKGQLETNSSGYIITDSMMRTSMPGVFAAGDLRVTPIRQVLTAASDGAVAAVSANEHLMGIV